MNTTFNELLIGTTFRALRNDIVGHGPVSRIVQNNSVYIKTGHNCSLDIKSGKDCIFLLGMPVRTVEGGMGVDVKNTQSYKLNMRGAA